MHLERRSYSPHGIRTARPAKAPAGRASAAFWGKTLDPGVYSRPYTSWRGTKTMLSIGQVAKQTGVAVDTIRFYEKQGLLGRPPRTAGGYREYDPEAVRVLRFIARAKALGFTLREVKQLLRLHRGSRSTRADF